MEGYQQAQPIAPPEATMGLVSPGPPPPPPSVEVTAVTEGGGISGDAMQPQKKVRRSRGEKVPRWTTDEEDRLRALVAQYGDRAWAKVAESLATGRTAAGVDQHWQIMNGKRKRNGKKAEQTLPMATSVAAGDGSGGAALPEATNVVVTTFDLSGGGTPTFVDGAPAEKKTRTRRASGKILRWTPEEEVKLKALVEEKGTSGKWQAIADELGTGRTAAGVDQHWQIMSGRRKRYAQASSKAGAAGGRTPAVQGEIVAVDGSAANLMQPAMGVPPVVPASSAVIDPPAPPPPAPVYDAIPAEAEPAAPGLDPAALAPADAAQVVDPTGLFPPPIYQTVGIAEP